MPISNIICPICCEVYKNSDEIHSTNCGHIFHNNCMNDWLRRERTCPQCRSLNITNHRLNLNFEETIRNETNEDEVKIKLKSSSDKISEMLEQLKEAERNFLQLQEQFNIAEKSKAELEESYSQMNDAEKEFLHLQGKYTESSEMVKELEDRIQQLFIENECKARELTLKSTENESLKSMFANGQYNTDNTLHEKVKILEQKLNHISEEFHKEIRVSTQLSIDKMKLQTYIKQLTAMEKNIKTAPKQEKSFHRQIVQKEIVSSPVENNDNKNYHPNSILVTNIPFNQITLPLENVIVNLGLKMKLSISADDLIQAKFLESKDPSRSKLFAQFKNKKLKDEFLQKKNILKSNPATNNIVILEFMDDDTFSLFNYAKRNLRSKGFNFIYSKDNNIFAKKSRSGNCIHIQSKSHVDEIKNLNAALQEFSNANNVDENLYQL